MFKGLLPEGFAVDGRKIELNTEYNKEKQEFIAKEQAAGVSR